MHKNGRYILKYLGFSVLAGLIYCIISYVQNGAFDINATLLDSGILFIFLCLLAYVSPKLRKVLGFKDED